MNSYNSLVINILQKILRGKIHSSFIIHHFYSMAEKGPDKTYEYPYVGFHFRVHFEGYSEKQDVSFQSVKGLEVQLDIETIKEGGVNTYEHTVPVRAKYSALTLERGILNPGQSQILNWCKAAFFDFNFTPINLEVQLLDEIHQPLITWKVRHVLPKSWKIKDLNAQQGEVLIETLELSYNAFSIQYKS